MNIIAVNNKLNITGFCENCRCCAELHSMETTTDNLCALSEFKNWLFYLVKKTK